MNSSLSLMLRFVQRLLPALCLLGPALGVAQKVEVAKDLPPDQRERLQLAADAMTTDRTKKDYVAAKKKLEKGMKLCKAAHCPEGDQAQFDFFLGIVLAEKGDEKAAQSAFERALKIDPTLDASGGLSSPPVDRAFAAARVKFPAPTVAPAPPAPTTPAAPSDHGFTQPSGQLDTEPLTQVGGAKYQPGLGFARGSDPTQSSVKEAGSAAKITLPPLDQSSFFDDRRFRYNVGIAYSDYKFSGQAGQEKLGGLLVDLRMGMSVPWKILVPYFDLDLSGGKFGDHPKILLFSGGDYELWNFNGDARVGLDLALGPVEIGGYGGAFLSYYLPSLENLPTEPSNSGKDAGPLYGARARIGSSVFLECSYTWRVGQQNTGRYRRIEVGALDDDGSGWSFFWDAREQPSSLAPNTATQEQRLIGAMPLNYTLGFSFRNY